MHRFVSIPARAVLLMAGVCATAHATDITTSGDTYIDTALPNANYGSNGIIAVSGTRIALVKFDTATIKRTPGREALLTLKISLSKLASNGIGVYLIRGPWDEKTVTANTMPPLTEFRLDLRQLITRDFSSVVFDVSGALAAWRADPSQNFGIALKALPSPTANVQLGARELKNGAVLSISGATADSERRFWAAAESSVDLYANNGVRLVGLTSLAGKPVRITSAGRSIVNDPRTGGAWVTNTNSDQLARIGPDGTVQLSLNVSSPTAVAADPRDGGVWTSIAVGSARALVKYNRSGQEVVRVTGLSGGVFDLGLDAADGIIWIVDTFNQSVVRLTGTDAQLNGYDVSGPSGTHHTRLAFDEPSAVAVNPSNDGQGAGNVWVGNRIPAEVTKLTPNGSEIFTTAPSTGFEVRGIEADRLFRGGAALVNNGNEGFSLFDVGGREVQFLRFFTAVSDFSKLKFASFPTAVSLDPYRKHLWGAVEENTFKNGALRKTSSYLMGYSQIGALVDQLVWTRGRILSVALQEIGVSVTVANGGVLDVFSHDATTTITVLSSANFDALQIDLAHAHLGRSGALPISSSAGDKNGDGRPDLTLTFRNSDSIFECHDSGLAFTASMSGSGIPASAIVPVTANGGC
jgi:hypothetical protein